MCDIYFDRCRVCQRKIEMHLGDFKTGRWEIMVFHAKCFERWVQPYLPRLRHFGWILWRGKTRKGRRTREAVVVYLTENAWKNREINHPNWVDACPLKPRAEQPLNQSV